MPFKSDNLDDSPTPRLPGLPPLGGEQWIGEPGLFQFRVDPFDFSGSVGPNGDNRREDVIKAQLLLGNSGHYRIAGSGVPTGWPGGELFRSIRAYQKEKGLQADGLLLPPGPKGMDENGVGETLAALQDDLGDRLAGYAAPTPQEVDAHYENEARFSGAPDDGGEPKSPSDILIYDESGRPAGVKKIPVGPPLPVISRPAPGNAPERTQPRKTRSDVDPPQSSWRDGEQLAMVATPAQPVYAPPPVPSTRQTGTTKPPSPYPHEDPTVQAAGQQLQKIVDTGFGNAAANIKRWYENGQAFLDGFKRQDLPLNEAEQAAFTTLPGAEPTPPSRPISDADQAATRTPPLVPPKADTKPQGRPAEEREPTLEKLIPPEMKEWHEGLEPFDQALVRDLMILLHNKHGILGKPGTRDDDLFMVKTFVRVRNEEFPELKETALHLYGSYLDGDKTPENYRKQEVIKKEGETGLAGSSRPDISTGHPDDPSIRARANTINGRWVKMTDGSIRFFVPSPKEESQKVRLQTNAKGYVITIPKSEDYANREQWEKEVELSARMILLSLRAQMRNKGFIEDRNDSGDLPAPPEWR